ncbi:MAG: hypothetical protein AMXMBFR81_17670 [Chthonomonas sp.]
MTQIPSSPDLDPDFNRNPYWAIDHLDNVECVNGPKLLVVLPHGFRSMRRKQCQAIGGWLAAAPHRLPDELDRLGAHICDVNRVACTDKGGKRKTGDRSEPLPSSHTCIVNDNAGR